MRVASACLTGEKLPNAKQPCKELGLSVELTGT